MSMGFAVGALLGTLQWHADMLAAAERENARRIERVAARRRQRLHVATVAAQQDMRQRDLQTLRDKLRDEYRTGLDAPPDNPLKLQER